MSEQELSNEQPPAPAQPALTGKRANWVIAHKIDVEAQLVTWQVKGAGELRLNIALVAEANRRRAMLHGFVQRVSDAAAMARDPKTGASATPQEKFEAMKRLVGHYEAGCEEWSPARESGGGGSKGTRVDPNKMLLVRALVIHAPEKGAETIAKFVSERSAAQVTALLFSEQLKEAVELAREQLNEEAKKASEGVDVAGMLEGL